MRMASPLRYSRLRSLGACGLRDSWALSILIDLNLNGANGSYRMAIGIGVIETGIVELDETEIWERKIGFRGCGGIAQIKVPWPSDPPPWRWRASFFTRPNKVEAIRIRCIGVLLSTENRLIWGWNGVAIGFILIYKPFRNGSILSLNVSRLTRIECCGI